MSQSLPINQRPILEIAGLEAGYGGSQVLRGLDLAVAEGEVMALLGRNGMGKTTLLRCLMGLLPSKARTLSFRGESLAGRRPDEAARRGLAYVPQGREIFGALSVEENLRLARLGCGGRTGGNSALPARLFSYFPLLAERRDQRAGTLSGGQQQQLAIARALAMEPAMLLLDEPSEGIQPSVVIEIGASLAAIARAEGLSVLLIEQNVALVRQTAARCAFMEKGRIAALHPVADLADAGLLQRFLGL